MGRTGISMVTPSRSTFSNMLPQLPPTPLISYLVRTWFQDEEGWSALVSMLRGPDPFGLVASVEPLSDPRFAEADVSALIEAVPFSSRPLVLADRQTFRAPDFPVLVAGQFPGEEPFRAYLRDLAVITINLQVGNLGWGDFDERDDQGVWAGPQVDPPP